MIPISLFTLLLAVGFCAASNNVPNTFPHAYPGMPTTAFGPDWQNYFEVDGLLPNLTAALTRSFAGNVGVNRANHPNATLFFWAFEKVNGSLTGAADSTDPWIIWLNGGPGDSSLQGLMTENGPIYVNGDYSIVNNNYGWSQLADVVWVDQPVGTGYSTSDTESYVANEGQMAEDFVGFLSNMVKIFPSLATRPLHLMGESYAGRYIPYITKTIFSTPNPPVALKKISIGDGALGSLATFEQLPTLTTIETYPQLIGYDPDVYNYFKTQEHLCGYDLNLTYPQNGLFPTLESVKSLHSTDPLLNRARKSASTLLKVVQANNGAMPLNRREVVRREERRQEWKRSLAGRPSGTLDPLYGCRLFEELWDTAFNFSSPWRGGSIDVYDIIDALDPPIPSDPSFFLNHPTTRAALHAPTSKNWVESFNYPFGGNDFGDPSPEPMVFLSELAANASALGVGIIFYSGNDDSISAHRGTEVVIQNMTFGGVQGFTRKPGTPFQDDQGNFAGIVHQERGLTYALFQNAGHFVAQSVPGAAFAFVRDFVLGSNTTGLVDSDAGTVAGGEDRNLQENVLPGNLAILQWAEGGITVITSAIAPSATIAAWNAFIATATATTARSAAVGLRRGGPLPWGLLLGLAAHLL
ncbi:alpha/beta-hydrolase [Mycena alexandri]|uniref:Carboxypeptidase n=1 Tax=Mycena alexandri TaxID=1745969 RepID=A0AAD6SYI1_9AGAR|nr:alpha/beta-hydrolase [Mycena alexandri]